MRREDHRCIVTRRMGSDYYRYWSQHADETALSLITGVVPLELCHIFSESTNAALENAREVTDNLLYHYQFHDI